MQLPSPKSINRRRERLVHIRDRQWLGSAPSPTYRTICLGVRPRFDRGCLDNPEPFASRQGRQLITADYITKLPKAEQNLEEWPTASGCLIGAAEGRDFMMHSRIGVLRALNRNVKGMFNSGHKDTLGKTRKIKAVQGISESWAEAEGK
jgi:hypothetical protein